MARNLSQNLLTQQSFLHLTILWVGDLGWAQLCDSSGFLVGPYRYLQLATGLGQLGFVSEGHLALSWCDGNE